MKSPDHCAVEMKCANVLSLPLVRRDLSLAGFVRFDEVLGDIHVTCSKRHGADLHVFHSARHSTAGQRRPDPEFIGPGRSFDVHTS